jgi:hypothetical protein
MAKPRCLAMAFLMVVVGCGEGNFDGTVAATASTAPVLFAFKAGLNDGEQIWLWLQDGRVQKVPTGPARYQPTSVAGSTLGYLEGFGRFGPLRFAQQKRFLIATERLRDNPGPPPTWRLLRYELETGKVSYIPAPAEAAGQVPDLTQIQVVTSDLTTMVIAHRLVPGGVAPALFELRGDTLVPAPSDGPIDVDADWSATAFDLAGETILMAGQLLRRREGVWRAVVPRTEHFDTFGGAHLAPTRDALCMMRNQGLEQRQSTFWLLTARGEARALPCDGRPSGCAFSPRGDLLYLSGCAQPLVDRAGQARDAPRYRLFDGARVVQGGDTLTLGVPEPSDEEPRPRPVVQAFDWNTLTLRPYPPLERQPASCPIYDVRTPPSGTGIGVVSTSCGCIDCDDGASYALDLQAQTVSPIYPSGGSSFIRGSILLGSAVVTTASGGSVASAGTLLWSDTSGTRTVGPLPGVSGILHGPVAF